MLITIKNKSADKYDLINALYSAVRNSRFKCDIEIAGDSVIKIRNVRLIESKEYCGNHPNACEVTIGQKPRKANYLEGADWVEWNDLVNDVCDYMDVDARVRTSICEVRDGRKRRINYTSYVERFSPILGEIWQWDKRGRADDYEDWCGHIAPNSDFPIGTPGLYLRNNGGVQCPVKILSTHM